MINYVIDNGKSEPPEIEREPNLATTKVDTKAINEVPAKTNDLNHSRSNG